MKFDTIIQQLTFDGFGKNVKKQTAINNLTEHLAINSERYENIESFLNDITNKQENCMEKYSTLQQNVSKSGYALFLPAIKLQQTSKFLSKQVEEWEELNIFFTEHDSDKFNMKESKKFVISYNKLPKFVYEICLLEQKLTEEKMIENLPKIKTTSIQNLIALANIKRFVDESNTKNTKLEHQLNEKIDELNVNTAILPAYDFFEIMGVKNKVNNELFEMRKIYLDPEYESGLFRPIEFDTARNIVLCDIGSKLGLKTDKGRNCSKVSAKDLMHGFPYENLPHNTNLLSWHDADKVLNQDKFSLDEELTNEQVQPTILVFNPNN